MLFRAVAILTMSLAIGAAVPQMERLGLPLNTPLPWLSDWRVVFFSPAAEVNHEEVAVVLVTEQTLAPLPYLSPTDRDLLARVITEIDAMAPAAIAVDFFFDRATEPRKDAALLRALADARAPVVIATNARAQRSEFERRVFEETRARPGDALLPTSLQPFFSGGGVVKRFPQPGGPAPPFATVAAGLAASDPARAAARPDYIDWRVSRDGVDPFFTYPVPPADAEGPLLPSALANVFASRIVFLGKDVPWEDRHVTPISLFDRRGAPGVLVHAQATAQLLDGRIVVGPTRLQESLACVVFALFGALAALIARPLSRLAAGAGIVALYFALEIGLYLALGVVISASALFAAVAGGFFAGLARRRPRSARAPARAA